MLESLQLWRNLPKRDKMIDPWHRDFKTNDLPKFMTTGGVVLTVIAGESHGVTGAVTRDATQLCYLHLPCRCSAWPFWSMTHSRTGW